MVTGAGNSRSFNRRSRRRHSAMRSVGRGRRELPSRRHVVSIGAPWMASGFTAGPRPWVFRFDAGAISDPLRVSDAIERVP